MNMEILNERAVREKLNSADLVEFLAAQRSVGRHNLPSELRRDWAAWHAFATEVSNCKGYGQLTKAMAKVLYEVTYFVGTVPAGGQPNYYQYTDTRLLDWYLEPDNTNIERVHQRTLDGIYAMFDDLLAFEIRSLAKLETAHNEEFDSTCIERRIELTTEAMQCAQSLGAKRAVECDIPPPKTVQEHVQSASRIWAITHFMCVPLSRSHDEVVFIRALQGSELCFFGIRVMVSAAIEAIKCGQPHLAFREISEARKFARLLHEFLKVLRTMPVHHFGAFRALTGGASAIQSVGYHLMDTVLRGVNTEKLEHFKKIDYLKAVMRFGDQRFISLKQALRLTDETDPQWQEVWTTCKQLDRDLLTWRGFHVSLAKLYLGYDPGSGGTAGAMYLREHLFKGMFDDVEPDWEVLGGMFPEMEPLGHARIKPGVMVAP
jgi:tryptophan 2,3-dioxygenase